jgi:hypothetical protein
MRDAIRSRLAPYTAYSSAVTAPSVSTFSSWQRRQV